jgi:YggT family protein
MRFIMQMLSSLIALYMFLIFIRIILTWFSGARFGRPMEILEHITDPYLDWWRRIPGLRFGSIDLSPVLALSVLSLAQNVFTTIARYGRITLGIILAIVLQGLWSVAAFLLGFLILILILCLIANLFRFNISNPFWRIINSISQPVLFRINRIIIGKRLVNYQTSIIISLIILVFLRIAGGFAIKWGSEFLSRLPI